MNIIREYPLQNTDKILGADTDFNELTKIEAKEQFSFFVNNINNRLNILCSFFEVFHNVSCMQFFVELDEFIGRETIIRELKIPKKVIMLDGVRELICMNQVGAQIAWDIGVAMGEYCIIINPNWRWELFYHGRKDDINRGMPVLVNDEINWCINTLHLSRMIMTNTIRLEGALDGGNMWANRISVIREEIRV